jgi:aspartyl-tRNA(Asn)/glutamyl-tRNA(Gln) amidotransferase subunit B
MSPRRACQAKPLTHAAIGHEVSRQIAVLERGELVEQDTRGYDEATGTTFRLRSKADAPDYRYMPDPSLPPLVLTQVRHCLSLRTGMS